MCGIVGKVDFARDLRDDHAVIRAMTETMRDRGPDDAGTWSAAHVQLGHRRLAVIDLAGGRQPMVATRGRTRDPAAHRQRHGVVLVYSGEVYNYSALRGQLAQRGHEFTTRSDTEVVLRSYLEWGPGCAEHLNGMFAFAVWDAGAEQLTLVRDRLGVKPLYYAPRPHGVLFASEPKGILADPGFSTSVPVEALPLLFSPRMALPGETPLRGLREVKPGHVLRVDRRGCHEYPYWRLVSHEHDDDERTTVDTVRARLTGIVERQLVADVPRSVLLSGGLDSGVVAALAHRTAQRRGDGPLRSFTVEFERDDEDFRATPLRPERDAPYALLTAKHLGTHHTSVVLDPLRLEEASPAALHARDLPSFGQFDESMYQLFRRMREECTVALSGEAADEVFGGYPWFHDPATIWADTFPWLGNAPRLTDCLAPDLRERLRPDDEEHDRYATLRAQVPRLSGERGLRARMREVLFFSLQGPLSVILDRKDRMSMALGLEVRVPYCDHELLQYVWNVPWEWKAADGREKSLLRAAAADLLPPQVLHRAKSAYPATHDPDREASTLRRVTALPEDPASPLYGLLDARRVREIAYGAEGATTMTYASRAHLLSPLAETDRWMRAYGLTVG
ncbi:asparagine synthase (glutamine-hydrolyzing) [Streptomyces sp. NRRL B-1347]|uniref:asparagine synthase (glutamine-hydrolyzing) n=1 Tax=Streptomyces sp. NRRL B-1347 TaxID=1476877 RepID=UPI0004C5D287|nr:asparagine synthase (glutamine-hydrolyzing) [Streptomyces sp. NRRL B-1347]